jgi:predicted nucleic acid-binding protein
MTNGEMDKAIRTALTQSAHDMPSDGWAFIRQKMCELAPGWGLGQFELRLVLDTNILYQSVRGKMLDGTCLLEKLAGHPALKLYAPPLIRDEIMAKIALKFPKDRATRELDIETAQRTADGLLAQIEITNDIDPEAMARAKARMAGRDEDDAPFLAMSFAFGDHGVVTMDKDLIDQADARCWRLREVGDVMTTVHNGTLLVFITGATFAVVLEAIVWTISAMWRGALDMAGKLAHALQKAAPPRIVAMRRNPWVVLLIALGALVIEMQTGILRKSAAKLRAWAKRLVEFFRWLFEQLAGFCDVAKPVAGALMAIAAESMQEAQSFAGRASDDGQESYE